jgi:hypothetical protein
MKKLIEHWIEAWQDDFPKLLLPGDSEWGVPFCFACEWQAPVEPDRPASWNKANSWLDRAHLRDRAKGGPDSAHNLVPLCHLCHDRIPSFDDRATAVEWVNSVRKVPTLWNLFTYSCLWGATPSRSTTLLRAWSDYHERMRIVYLAVRSGADVDVLIAQRRAGVPLQDICDELGHRLTA